MGTQLLILKNDTDYIRIREGEYSACRLDRASVFPLEMLDTVREHQKKMKQAGFLNPEIFKLILTEAPFYTKENREGNP